METIENQLNTVRDELLDLSLRNTLLNYRHLKSRGIETVDELPEQIFRMLALESRPLTFLPAPEEDPDEDVGQPLEDTVPVVDRSSGAPPTFFDDASSGAPLSLEGEKDLGVEPEIPDRHTDRQLQTPYTSADLQKRLLNSFYTARTSIEEQGVNILYMAFGMLQWRETPGSEPVRLAPLILVPVELDRTNVQTKFRVRYTEDDIGDNISLRAKLKADYLIDLPQLDDSEEIDVQAYFDRVEAAIRPQKEWTVDRSAIVLAFFSFSRFLMYNDLDVNIWPEPVSPLKHPLMEALVMNGFHESPSIVGDDDFLDNYVSPEESFEILDADSSQTLAILDVKQGRNLIIQGPPGTGKSQTITNLIAEAIGQNKTVLFVAEKMAALEVVKRRLDGVGLGDACLELHSHRTNKKTVLAELKRTLELGRPKLRDYTADFQTLIDNRDQLNAYSSAVNTPILSSGLSPFKIYGQLMHLQNQLRGVETPFLDGRVLMYLTEPEAATWYGRINELQALVARIGIPEKHVFWGSGYQSYLPTDRRTVQDLCRTASTAVNNLESTAANLAAQLKLAPPQNRGTAEELLKNAQLLLTAPSLTGIQVRAEEWRQRSKDIVGALAAGQRFDQLHQQYDPLLLPQAWQQNVLPIRQAYMVHGPKWYRFLSGEFRTAKNTLTGMTKSGLPDGLDAQRALVEAIIEAQQLLPKLQQSDPFLQWLFGSRYKGPGSNWADLTQTAEWLITFYQQIEDETLLLKLLAYLDSKPDFSTLQSAATAVQNALAQHQEALTAVVRQLQLDEPRRFGPRQALLSQSLATQRQLFQDWFNHVDQLQDMVVFNHHAAELEKGKLAAVTNIAASWPQAASFLTLLVRRTRLEALLQTAMSERPSLATFNTEMQEQRIQRFGLADKTSFEINRTQLADRHWQRMPRQMAGGQLGILLREFEKKRRHRPIRKLMMDAGNAIQTIKPVFMMSPLSIPKYLPPGSLHFDLVVFDEASQVRPVEAFGAILRGNQCVVVGDSKQLPPTNFFNQVVETDEEAESPTADLESVLGLFAAQGAPQRMLRWHYRSRHESLITVSNYEFYDNKLVIFPSPDASKSEAGVIYHYLPDTAYDRGQSSTNLEEARIVAQAVMEHARKRPHLTLGVAAFSLKQRAAIQDEVERLRRQSPDTEPFFNTEVVEPFFVKNLENVQGDERDVIFISVGYGKTADGKLSMNFGPLNKDGGERRLNVLITRARLRCEIFTNLAADDIDLSRTNARGVEALKRYLKYAETGHLDVPAPTEGEVETRFEEIVMAALAERGHEMVTRVGAADFRIDLAIVDKDQPDRYVLGVEFDGPSYDQARSARDRDRIWQSVLENMGWNLHRVWSTDWFRNPEQELQRTLDAIQAGRQEVENEEAVEGFESQQPSILESPIVRQEDKPATRVLKAQPYQVAQPVVPTEPDLADMPSLELAGYVTQVVETEGPVHEEEVYRRILDAAGKRMGSRIKANLETAVTQAIYSKNIHRRGEFLWPKSMRYTVRSHADMPDFSRRLEQIAPEEVRMAIKRVVENGLGMYRADIPSEVGSLLGFGLTSEKMRQQIDTYIGQMIATKELKWRGDYLISG